MSELHDKWEGGERGATGPGSGASRADRRREGKVPSPSAAPGGKGPSQEGAGEPGGPDH